MTTQPFDPTGPLPERLLAIEASAGTGKTFTLSALATRLVAEEGIAASELLIVTFTRAATAELRSRVRQQLLDTSTLLRVDALHTDALLAHLADTSAEERSLRCERMERAVSEFDTATVTTIHGFATQVLGTLGVTAGTDLDATLLDDTEDLLPSVCSDVLAAAAVTVDPTATLPTLKALVEATDVAARIPDLDLVPTVDEPGTDPSQRLAADLVRRCVEAIHRRRRHAGTLSFDDVLSELRDALHGPGAQAVIAALRQRFRAALIDEFQDTDPVQWDIFSTLFGSDGSTRLILVGDPKQAIYSFRGADIATYADAVAPRPGLLRRSLTTNWRADGAVVGSLNTLFDGVAFGSEAITYSDVSAAPQHEDLRLEAADGSPLPALAIR
ncbi:MAG: UvrD-helicase domain-containing protein, partial [Actinobacteria bacterium]|nr:UvrD-helicase domain-containing protein [Actinomycetota bacterium]